jgi:VIT1/CCC1 family predicted Fe2+/Mn2+ transporter
MANAPDPDEGGSATDPVNSSRESSSVRGMVRLRMTRTTEESTAAGIYGVIVASSVMAATHAETAIAVDLAVLVTLVVYWGAERYARLVAQRIHDGHRPDRRQLRRQLTTGWAMVSASAVPLIVLLVVRLLGVGLTAAVLSALASSTVLLAVAGWEIGRDGKLSRGERLASAATAAAFGGALIVLKMLLH